MEVVQQQRYEATKWLPPLQLPQQCYAPPPPYMMPPSGSGMANMFIPIPDVEAMATGFDDGDDPFGDDASMAWSQPLGGGAGEPVDPTTMQQQQQFYYTTAPSLFQR